MPLRRLPLLLTAALATGCLPSLDLRTDDPPAGLQPDGDLDRELPDDTGFGIEATWGVSGVLVIREGAVDAAASSLLLETRGVACAVTTAVVAAAPLAPPLPEIEAAWTLSLETDPDSTCTWVGPTNLRLGLGRSDEQLRPAADRAGLLLDRSLGLYAAAGRGPVYLVGLARSGGAPGDTDAPSETDLPGESDAPEETGETDAPPPSAADTDERDGLEPPRPVLDGAWQLHTLHGIPLTR